VPETVEVHDAAAGVLVLQEVAAVALLALIGRLGLLDPRRPRAVQNAIAAEANSPSPVWCSATRPVT
jgi:hypothetical protein